MTQETEHICVLYMFLYLSDATVKIDYLYKYNLIFHIFKFNTLQYIRLLFHISSIELIRKNLLKTGTHIEQFDLSNVVKCLINPIGLS